MINYLIKINDKKKIALAPINKKVLEIGDMVGYFYEFFPGKNYSKIKIPRKLYSFGKIVGEFSQQSKNIALKSWEDINKNKKDTLEGIRNLRRSLTNKQDIYLEIFSLIDSSWPLVDKSPIKGKYRKQLVHGDLHMDNVFYNEKTKKSLIADVDGLDGRIISKEVAVILSYELTNSVNKNEKMIREIFRGYESKYELTRSEKKIIPQLMIIRKYGEILWLVEQYRKGSISVREFKTFIRTSLRHLRIISGQYSKLSEIFKKI